VSQQTTVDGAGEVARAVAAGVSRLMAGRLTPAQRERQLDELAGLYGEVTDVRHPFDPRGDTPMRTRAELREHFAAVRPDGVERFEPVDATVHVTADPEVVVFEFAYAVAAHGAEAVVPCIFVLRVRDGRIVESRDYAHHLAMARVLGARATAAPGEDQERGRRRPKRRRDPS
jgi:ketosteroid isomerase-like protein